MTDVQPVDTFGTHPTEQTEVRTFLFADIRGYTRFTQEHGDEAGARLAAKFAAVSRDVVAQREGRVIELRGDEALAVFASPRQALRAAIELQRRYEEETALDPSTPMTVGVGLDAGEAVAVEDGYRGGALNLAARLCSLAGPGEVLASEGVTHLARKIDGVMYHERGFAPLKGFSDPIRVISITSGGSLSDRSIETDTGTTEPTMAEEAANRLPIGGFLGALPGSVLVGREQELNKILGIVDAVTGSSGQLVVLSGEPGVGKTRLAQEVTLNVRNRGFLVAVGRCYEPHRGVPYYPFLDALAMAYAACPATVRVEVPRRWPQLVRFLPDLSVSNPSSGLDGQEEQQRLFRATTDFLQAIAAQMPVALMLDDVHWADEASLALLEHLARHTRADRVLLLASYRDTEVNRQHPLAATLRDLMREELLERVNVRRLSIEGTARLMAANFGEEDISDGFARLVHDRTEGNPFFVQHVLRVLVERGDIFRRNGRWDRRNVEEIEVPETVRSVIAQHVSRLSDQAQEVLREASVLGQTFSFDHLQQITARPEQEIEVIVEEIEATGMLRDVGRDSYAFDHALTQQSLYAELPGRRRRKIHLAAAHALESLPQPARDQRTGELAWHFREGDDLEHALPYTLLAGRQLEDAFALEEAERQYSVAVELARAIPDHEGEAEALSRRAKVRLDRYKGTEAIADYEKLVETAHRKGDQDREVGYLLGLARGYYLVALDSPDTDLVIKVRDTCSRAYDLAARLGDKPGMVRALLGTRWLTDYLPEYRLELRSNLFEAVRLSEETSDPKLITEARLASWFILHRSEGEAIAESLVRELEASQDLRRLNDLLFMLMWTHLRWGDFERGVERCDAGIRVATALGVPPVMYPTLKALLLICLGRYGQAWESLEQEVSDQEHPFGLAMQSFGTGMYFYDLLDFDRAADTFAKVVRQAERVQRRWMVQWGQALEGASSAQSGRRDAAIPDEPGDASVVTQARIGSARLEVLLARGNLDEALATAERLVMETKAERLTMHEVVVGEIRLRVLLAMGRAREVVALADQLIPVVEGMTFNPMLWRIRLTKARALTALGDEGGAKKERRPAKEIVHNLAGSIDDVELRQQFVSAALGPEEVS